MDLIIQNNNMDLHPFYTLGEGLRLVKLVCSQDSHTARSAQLNEAKYLPLQISSNTLKKSTQWCWENKSSPFCTRNTIEAYKDKPPSTKANVTKDMIAFTTIEVDEPKVPLAHFFRQFSSQPIFPQASQGHYKEQSFHLDMHISISIIIWLAHCNVPFWRALQEDNILAYLIPVGYSRRKMN